MNVQQTLADLVRIDSRSSVSNLEMINYLAPRCERLGFCARLLPYVDEAGVKKFNLVAVAPKETKDDEVIELALVGHTDTVQKPQIPFIFSPFLPTATLTKTLFRASFTQDSHKESVTSLSRLRV